VGQYAEGKRAFPWSGPSAREETYFVRRPEILGIRGSVGSGEKRELVLLSDELVEDGDGAKNGRIDSGKLLKQAGKLRQVKD
jgi:hypothetical protein